jgi:hypothetical protein
VKAAVALCLLLGCQDAAENPFAEPAAQPFFVISTRPPYADTGVPTDVGLTLKLSDAPYPPSLAAAWSLFTASSGVTSFASVDLVDPQVTIRSARGLLPHIAYQLNVTSRLHSFADAPLEPTEQLRFTTGTGPGPATAPPPVVPVARVVTGLGSCAAANCHVGAAPARGLDLSSPAGLAAAVSAPSTDIPALPLVAPGAHAGSYLVWKALGLARTLGHRQPTLAHDDARALADWIDQGAQGP